MLYSYTMGCPPVRGLSYVQVDKHGITILYHLQHCRPCTSRYVHAKDGKCGIKKVYCNRIKYTKYETCVNLNIFHLCKFRVGVASL